MLDAHLRPLDDLHSMLADVICMIARNEFSLTIPPRWLGEIFEMVNRAVPLKTQACNWSLEVSPGVDQDCQDYIAASALNIENDQRRSKRQRFK